MSTFDSTKRSLADLLRDITSGRIQLPDFQRGWVWDDDHVRDLLISVARAFPVGAIMLLETGGDVRFQVRPVEGVEEGAVGIDPERLILDGQQRLTTLTQAIALPGPVQTQTAKGKPILRHYYFDIERALSAPERLEEAIVAVDERRRLTSDFGRSVDMDLSTVALECREMMFPCNQILNSDHWEEALQRHEPENFGRYMEFRGKVIKSFRDYQIPVIELKKDTGKEAVCLVFEKVNTGGVSLSVFELVTASYAADGYNLRDDWYGSEHRNVESRRERLSRDPLLADIKPTEFLQAATLLSTIGRKARDIADGRTGKQVRPVSAKRAEVLDLSLADYRLFADELERGFQNVGHFLRHEAFYSVKEIPYSTQLVPLAAVLARLGDRWREPRVHEKLRRWYWCGALGELYGGATETRIANDFEELLQWTEDEDAVPRTVREASFQPERLEALRIRISAAYRAVNVLVLREGARDFFWDMRVKELDEQDIPLDIHHIFPKAWCEKQGIPVGRYDNILNKTPISAKTNRMIGPRAPSDYLRLLQAHDQVQRGNEEMDKILSSHAIAADRLRVDDFDGFLAARREALLRLIERAMGKPVLVAA